MIMKKDDDGRKKKFGDAAGKRQVKKYDFTRSRDPNKDAQDELAEGAFSEGLMVGFQIRQNMLCDAATKDIISMALRGSEEAVMNLKADTNIEALFKLAAGPNPISSKALEAIYKIEKETTDLATKQKAIVAMNGVREGGERDDTRKLAEQALVQLGVLSLKDLKV